MTILGWVVYPALAPDFEADPLGAAAVRMGAITVGLIWQFVLAMIFVYREEGDLRWATIRRRLWLNTPRDPKTGEPRHLAMNWALSWNRRKYERSWWAPGGSWDCLS